MELRDALISTLRYELAGVLPEGFPLEEVDEAFLGELYDYANRQEVAHLVGDALDRLGILKKVSDETAEPYRRRMAVSAYHAEQQRQVAETVFAAFDEASIAYLPLKGLVIRKLYPEPWMRTAGDLDILVKDEDFAHAEQILLELGAKRDKEVDYEIAFSFLTGVVLELHRSLLEDERANGAKDALREVWEHAHACEGSCRFEMEDAWFYYYHLVHAAKHLEEGACGIRPLLDLWILNHKISFDAAARETVLEKNGLLQFAKTAEALSEVWFSGKEGDEWTHALETLLLTGGVFGNSTTKYSMATGKKHGTFYYYLQRIFLPYGLMKQRESVLERHPWLFPFLQVKRWFSFLFCGGLKRSRHTAKEAKGIGGEHTIAELKEHMGLSE